MKRKETWKEKVEARVITPIIPALETEGIKPLAIFFDFKNCVIRVVVPEGTEVDEMDRIEALCPAPPKVVVMVEPPKSYPFTNHMNGPMRKMKTYELTDPIRKIEIQIDHLEELNAAYGLLESMTAEFDKVATFALGGLVPLIHISQRQATKTAQSDEARRAAKSKFHLFPGLLWGKGSANRREFMKWIGNLDHDSSLLIFDTSFSGGGINRIRRCLQMYSKKGCGPFPKTIRIVGIIDTKRLGAKKLHPHTIELLPVSGHGCRVQVEYLFVPSLLAEDVSELIGYGSLRGLGSMEGLWSAAILYLIDEEQRVQHMQGTRSLSTSFYGLLLNTPQSRLIEADETWMLEQVGVSLAINKTIENEADQLWRALKHDLIDEATFDREHGRLPAIGKGAMIRAQEGLKFPTS